MSNLTVDDTSSNLFYGPGWGVASPNDTTLNNYFLSTYHASVTPGALVNLSFPGTATAIYLYGSKGPNCGTFSVRWDNNIQQLSAFATTQGYQQLLFGVTFPQTSGIHTLTLNNTSNEQGPKWLDLDFFTITDGNTSASHARPTVTISPLPVRESVTASDSPITAGTQASSTGRNTRSFCSSSSCNTTLYVSITLGIVLFLLLLGSALYVVMRNCIRKPPQSHTIDNGHRRLGSNVTQSSLHRPGSAFLETRGRPVFSYQYQPPIPQHFQPAMVTTNLYAKFDAIEPTHGIDPEEKEGSTSTTLGYNDIPHPHVRKPFSGNAIRALFGGVKEGADSMKSTFLKV